jgi:hypothetical protein
VPLFYFDLDFYLNLNFEGVRELLIDSEKTSTTPTFEENTERLLCSLFSVTREYDQVSKSLYINVSLVVN